MRVSQSFILVHRDASVLRGLVTGVWDQIVLSLAPCIGRVTPVQRLRRMAIDLVFRYSLCGKTAASIFGTLQAEGCRALGSVEVGVAWEQTLVANRMRWDMETCQLVLV